MVKRDILLRKLMEVEADGIAAAKHVSALRETVSQLCVASGISPPVSEALLLNCQKDQFLRKLETFEATNQTLRHLFREQYELQIESIHLQKDTLLTRLADTEAQNAHLVVKLKEKNGELKKLAKLLDTEKGNGRNTADLSKSLKSTRANLQGQLRSKEAENNRLSVQKKNLKQAANKQKAEKAHLVEQLRQTKEQASAERKPLKETTKALKWQAEHSEDTEKQVTDALSAAENWKSCYSQEMKDISNLQRELSLLNSNIAELTEQVQNTDNKSRVEREALLDHLHCLSTESTVGKLENQFLKLEEVEVTLNILEDKLSAVEEKLALSQSEFQEIKASIKQYESLLDSYKLKVGNTHAEAEEYSTWLAQAEQEAQVVLGELEQEIEKVRRELLGRLAELEPIPEDLQHTEWQLQESLKQGHNLGKLTMEHGTTLTDLRFKVETRGSQLDLFRQKNKVLLKENRHLQLQVESLERKLEEAGNQNSNLLAVITKQENIIHRNQLGLQEKNRECSLLNRKLEEALDDARQQMSETRKHAFTNKRCTHCKILDLETELSRTTSEVNQLLRKKDEMEQQFQSRLQNVKDRLDQSDSTSRSLQNYVQFLKVAYSTGFGDVGLSSSLCAPSNF